MYVCGRVCVGEYTPAPVQACVPLHVSVFSDVCVQMCNFVSVWESVCVCQDWKKKQKTEVQLHSQYTNNESQYKLQLQQQEPQRLISTLYSVYFL